MPLNILVADDSPTIQKVIQITLNSKQYELESSLTFESLNQELKNQTYHLVLLDFYLDQDVNGYQIAKAIKESSPSTKVIMMFGTFDEFDKDRLKDFGVEGHVVKPFDSKSFIGLCEKILNEDELILGNALIDNDLSEWKIDNSEFVSLPESDDLELPIDESMRTDFSKNQEGLSLSANARFSLDFSGEVPAIISNDTSMNIEKPPVINLDISSNNEDKDNTNQLNSEFDSSFDLEIGLDSTPNVDSIIGLDDDYNFSSSSLKIENDKEIASLPESADLDYPEISTQETNRFEDSFKSNVLNESILESENDDTSFLMTNDSDSTSDISAEEFWSIDDSSNDDDFEISNSFTDEKQNPQTYNLKLDLNDDEFEKLKPILDEKIKKYCEERIEDFAKNLFPKIANEAIEREIKRLTDMVDLNN